MSSMTGVILSGGKSSRMGMNKAFVEIEGKRLIDRTMATFKEVFQEIIIVTNAPLDYLDQGCIIASDIFKNKGALGGIYTGLFYASFDHAFVAACDMPFLNRSLIQHMVKCVDKYDVVVPQSHDGLQPLHAIYSKKCLKPIEKLMDADNLKITDFYRGLKTMVIPEEDIKPFDPEGKLFINVNTKKDLEEIS